ncbi:MAG: tRNA uridine-5-carboxymethylaminomethyl(34) synthesis GTPase MnmE [Candidatus Eremiobacteraeota bacterium]|nr:tRNA uridine-5-carboxymethylaminomethyl(34) synthesis GTPase MnmE [Candidatus Eremiobacteraeota bacterium]
MDFLMNDTIAAISTPPGEGGIGIVRISGDDVLEIVEKIFRGPAGNKAKVEPRKVHYGHILNPDTDERVDEVLLTYMKSPRSYTTQDVVEINCHGGPVILKEVLDLAVSSGARIAEPGEFTKRAFLGGRIDLTQAEAVMDIIRARTDESRRVAFSQLKGELSFRINKLMDDVIDFLIQLEARIDFCEDDIPSLDPGYKMKQVDLVLGEVNRILKNFEMGKIYREGIRASIVGPSNAGKSTLLNTLLGEERAIVTNIPGTTRDRIEETVNLRGVPLVLIDTAGLRKTGDPVESIGIEKTMESIKDADFVLLVLDASQEKMGELTGIMDFLDPKKTLVIMNKTDLGCNYKRQFLLGYLSHERIVEVSLLEKQGIEQMEERILSFVFGGNIGSPADVILSNARHKDALRRTSGFLQEARKSIESGMSDDFITIDLQGALDSLGEIVGKVSVDSLLDRIFSNFCIGK